MKRARLQFFVFAIAFMAVLSCEKDVVSPEGGNENAEAGIEEIPDDPNLAAFSNSLAKAFKDHEGLRAFVKERALQQFDNDYDVLYQMVKDEMVGGASFRDLLLQSGISREELQAVESEFPLLTIYVPDFSDLPENPFSAELWNTANQVPAVALAIGDKDTGISIYRHAGKAFSVKPDKIPGFPVVALKINERVVTSGSTSGITGKTVGKELKFHSGDQFSFSFIDKAFDGLNPSSEEKGNDPDMTNKDKIDPTLLRAYDEWVGSKESPGGQIWQREHIYYDFVRGRTEGDYRLGWGEYITDIEINPKYATGAFDLMTGGSGDPRIVDGGSKKWMNGWTEGKFEFSFVVAKTSKPRAVNNDGVGAIISVDPKDVFKPKFRKWRLCHDFDWETGEEKAYPGCPFWVHRKKEMKTKKYKIPGKGIGGWTTSWDISNQSFDRYLYIYELDEDGGKWKKEMKSHSVETTNLPESLFSYPYTSTKRFGKKLAWGLGAGGEIKKITLRYNMLVNSNFMGWGRQVFSDPIITDISPTAITFKEYDVGYMRVTIKPKFN